ncbi:DNA primase [Hippea maritima]|uniref:DNA primase n=1 Tax=Hippea maritima (strain ATCC 700847 / DSM 10411 / MH2) TaxID=760142 RepID=F2LUE1_HIPMA|nr:DNA primase [Hippea maritima]AEA33467.1 DNA primase [Hippea maritima DSM 10411]
MKDIVEEIKKRVDIVDFISGYVSLKKRGSNYFGLCPFHHEKTPSFSVNPKGGFYHCFGCGESGDVITFLMKIENLDFKEAIRELAKRYNIPIHIKERSKNDALFEIHSIAEKYFFEKLKLNKTALDYLKNRQINDDAIELFKIGFAPESSELEKILKKEGFKEKELINSGIFIQGSRGVFNRFSNRIIFPIKNEHGQTIAFGGRILNDDKTKAKYLNSPETPIFSKQKVLFGLNLAKDEIRKTKEVIVTEGYMDCLRLQISGIKNSTATLGTALSRFHINILKRMADKIYMNYDADDAGFRAILRSAPTILSSEMKPFVVILDKGEDPDSFIRNNSKEAYIKKLSSAKDYFSYIIDFIKNKYDIEHPSEKMRAIEELKPIILSVQEPILKAAYTSKASRVFNVSEDAFLAKTASFEFLSSITKQEALLSIILRDIELMAWIEDLDDFKDEFEGLQKELYLNAVRFYLSGEEFSIEAFEKNLSDSQKKLFYKLISLPQTDINERYQRRKVLLYLLAQFKLDKLKKQLRIIQQKIQENPKSEFFEEYNKTFSEIKEVLSAWQDS